MPDWQDGAAELSAYVWDASDSDFSVGHADEDSMDSADQEECTLNLPGLQSK
jgi:hypothetical protein